jgi:8-amino-7-oxononanoate synthase
VRAIVPPTVPRGTERVRACLHAGNTVEEIDGLVKRIGEWAIAQGLRDRRDAKL